MEVSQERKNVESVICPWCGTFFDKRPGTNCSNCGGALPFSGIGGEPPLAPRKLPKGFIMRMFIRNNALMHAGIIFILFNLVSLNYAGTNFSFLSFTTLIGIGMVVYGCYNAIRRFDILRHGASVEGHVVDAGENKDESVNGRHPYFIKYEYSYKGNMHSGFVNCWDESSTIFKPGDQVWVLCLPKGDEYRSTLWPPVA